MAFHGKVPFSAEMFILSFKSKKSFKQIIHTAQKICHFMPRNSTNAINTLSLRSNVKQAVRVSHKVVQAHLAGKVFGRFLSAEKCAEPSNRFKMHISA